LVLEFLYVLLRPNFDKLRCATHSHSTQFCLWCFPLKSPHYNILRNHEIETQSTTSFSHAILCSTQTNSAAVVLDISATMTRISDYSCPCIFHASCQSLQRCNLYTSRNLHYTVRACNTLIVVHCSANAFFRLGSQSVISLGELAAASYLRLGKPRCIDLIHTCILPRCDDLRSRGHRKSLRLRNGIHLSGCLNSNWWVWYGDVRQRSELDRGNDWRVNRA
jgi:hypothetical protein